MMSMMSTPSKRPVLPRKRFHAIVVLIFVDDEFQIHIIPAGEGAGGFADILLGVVAHAHGEHFHDFAREIFVGRAFDVDSGVEEGEHAGILRHGDHEVTEIAGAVVFVELQFGEELAVVADLGLVGGVMTVPEERHLFLERARAGEHAVGPPIGHAVGFENAGAEPVEKFVDDGLEAAVAGGLDLDAERFTVLLGHIGDGWAAGRKRFEAGIANAGFIEGGHVADVGAFVADQARDGLRRRHLGERVNLSRRASESGAFQQVRGEVAIPVFGADGREIVLPGGGSGGLGEQGSGRDRNHHGDG